MAYEKLVPDWQEDGSDIPASKLTTGWQESEKPPANWFNRFFYSVAQAVKELQTKTAEVEYVDEKITALNDGKISNTSITDRTGNSSTLVMSQKGVTDAIDAVSGGALSDLSSKVDVSAITDHMGTSTTLVMSQKGVTDGLDLKVNKSNVVSEIGTSTSNVASQKLVKDINDAQTTALTKGLENKVDITAITDSTGDGVSKVMSQKGVTDALALKVDKTNIDNSVSASTTKVPSSYAVQRYVEENTPTITYGTSLPTSANEGDIFILYN